MRTFSSKDSIYIGREAGVEIIKDIKKAKKSVKIVSPYLSSSYLSELVKLHNAGKQITLITCDKLSEGAKRYSDFQISDIIKQKQVPNPVLIKLRKKLLFISLIVVIASLPLFLFYSLLAYFALALAIILLLSAFVMQTHKGKYSSIFRLKVFDSASGDNPGSTELIHSKIFIIDEESAYLGSANFTYSGFKTHYETVIKVFDKNAIADISKEVEALYNSKDLRAKELDELV